MCQRSKLFLVGLLVLYWLSVPVSLIYSVHVEEMTNEEILTELEQNLTARENRLNERENRLNQRENQLNQREQILDKREQALTVIENYFGNLKDDLKSEYTRGFLEGSILGFSLGTVAGAWGGFRLGVTIRIP